jgi:hypothetical protein
LNVHAAVRDYAPAEQTLESLVLAPSLERRRLQCYAAQISVDIVALLSGFAIANLLYAGFAGVSADLLTAQLVLLIFLTIAFYNGSYSVDSIGSVLLGIGRSLVALILAALLVALIIFLSKSAAQFSRVGFFAGTALAAALLAWSRLSMRVFVRWRCGAHVRNELVIDDGGPAVFFPGAIQVSASTLGIRADLNDPSALDRVGSVLRNIDRSW